MSEDRFYIERRDDGKYKVLKPDAERASAVTDIISVPQRSISYIDYLHLSDQAKIIVSPWGYGEICYRDFEALLDDCVLVKPRTDFVQTLDNTIREGDMR